MFKNSVVDVAPGEEILWDGNLWTVVNVGDKLIYLSSNNGFANIEIEQFERLVFDGHIKGTDGKIIDFVNKKINETLTGASERDLKEANRRYKIILPHLGGEKIQETDDCAESTRTIRNWISSYRQAEQAYGDGYIGLIPRIKERGNRTRRHTEDTISVMNKFIEENENATNQSNKVLYGKFLLVCEDKGLIPPSSKYFYKAIKSRPEYERLKNTKGSRIAYEKEPFYWDFSLPRHGDRAWEKAHLDHTEIDLETVHSKTGRNLGKVWITVLFDAFSRRVLAFYIAYHKPSYISDMMVLRECVRRFGRLPQTIITDNGSDFRSVYYESLLAFYGVVVEKRPPHRSRYGSPGERNFGTTMTELIHNLRGNTKIMKNARQVTKSVNPQNWAVWHLPLLFHLLTEYLYEEYDTMEHSALGMSPREAFERSVIQSGNRPIRLINYDENFMIMTLPAAKRNNGMAKIDSVRGVKVNYIYYYCEEFRNLNKAIVPVRFDPWDAGTIYCYINSHWSKCNSQYPIFRNRSIFEIKIASAELIRQKQVSSKAEIANTRKLADFLARAEQTEEMLLQRMRDGETKPQLWVINGDQIDQGASWQGYSNQNDNGTEEVLFDVDSSFDDDNTETLFNIDDED